MFESCESYESCEISKLIIIFIFYTLNVFVNSKHSKQHLEKETHVHLLQRGCWDFG